MGGAMSAFVPPLNITWVLLLNIRQGNTACTNKHILLQLV